MAISKEFMANFRKICADILGIDEEMKPYRIQIFLCGGQLAASFTKDGASPALVLADLAAGFTDKVWQFIQTDNADEAVIIRISEIEAIKVINANPRP